MRQQQLAMGTPPEVRHVDYDPRDSDPMRQHLPRSVISLIETQLAIAMTVPINEKRKFAWTLKAIRRLTDESRPPSVR